MITLHTLGPSLIRTWVPILVGALVAWLLTLGIELDEKASTGLIMFGTALLTGIYYTVVRLAEQRWPQVGVLLGLPKTPDSYSNDQTIPGEVVEESLLSDYPTGDAEDLIDDGEPGRREAVA